MPPIALMLARRNRLAGVVGIDRMMLVPASANGLLVVGWSISVNLAYVKVQSAQGLRCLLAVPSKFTFLSARK